MGSNEFLGIGCFKKLKTEIKGLYLLRSLRCAWFWRPPSGSKENPDWGNQSLEAPGSSTLTQLKGEKREEKEKIRCQTNFMFSCKVGRLFKSHSHYFCAKDHKRPLFACLNQLSFYLKVLKALTLLFTQPFKTFQAVCSDESVLKMCSVKSGHCE